MGRRVRADDAAEIAVSVSARLRGITRDGDDLRIGGGDLLRDFQRRFVTCGDDDGDGSGDVRAVAVFVLRSADKRGVRSNAQRLEGFLIDELRHDSVRRCDRARVQAATQLDDAAVGNGFGWSGLPGWAGC